MRTPDAVRQQQWRDRQVKPTRNTRPDHHGRIEPDLHFCTPMTVAGYQPSKRAEIRPAFERLDASGPVLTLVQNGRPLFVDNSGIEGVRYQLLVEPGMIRRTSIPRSTKPIPKRRAKLRRCLALRCPSYIAWLHHQRCEHCGAPNPEAVQ